MSVVSSASEPACREAVSFTVSGELGSETVPLLAAAIDRELLRGNDVVLDLSRIEFIDSTALSALRGWVSSARVCGRRLMIDADLSAPIRRMMELVGLLPTAAAGTETATAGDDS